MNIEPCRTCTAPMIWAKTSTGTSIPLDATDDGELVMVDDSPLMLDEGLFPQARPVVRSTKGGPRGRGPRSHFASCPHAGEWRKGKKGMA